MAATIPNLWPVSEINLDMLTPLVILRTQGTRLQEFTKGVLEGEVKIVSTEKQTQLHLDVIAPALKGYRQRIVTVSYMTGNVYPVSFDALQSFDIEDWVNKWFVSTDREFMRTLSDVFESKKVKAILSSLLAQSNEQNNPVLMETAT